MQIWLLLRYGDTMSFSNLLFSQLYDLLCRLLLQTEQNHCRLSPSTHVPVPLVNPHPLRPPEHARTSSPHLNAHRNAKENDTIQRMLKTWPAWSALCPTAALMNGHSDKQTKLRLDLHYTVGSGVTQSTDRSRNQRWMLVSVFVTLNHSDIEFHAHHNTPPWCGLK